MITIIHDGSENSDDFEGEIVDQNVNNLEFKWRNKNIHLFLTFILKHPNVNSKSNKSFINDARKDFNKHIKTELTELFANNLRRTTSKLKKIIKNTTHQFT
ncbi:hypothetical protein ACTFIY_005004 [Dictyostelium cf. discoideum]